MPDQHTLEETEQATLEHVGHLSLDFGAMQAVSSLYRAANSARSHLTNTVLRRHELTWTGFLVLWLLWIWDRMETRRVAENVGISKATLTGVTNTLVNRGLVRRVPSTVDRRLVGLELTPEGNELMETLFPEFNSAEARIVSGLDAEQVQQLTVALRQIVSTVEERDADTSAATTES
ncbi:MarR family winged helix-turn-helix transcriptional regulator [Nocardioides sp.]|uniref:MarR family winged helix-turn-helix transcriptional regulator n=1 Tax=Nocardioides sp. TaxID=35761 RepID=UPI003D130A5C